MLNLIVDVIDFPFDRADAFLRGEPWSKPARFIVIVQARQLTPFASIGATKKGGSNARLTLLA
jgi:hypothetical protein